MFTGPEGYTGFTHHCLDTNLLQVSKTGSKLWDGLTAHYTTIIFWTHKLRNHRTQPGDKLVIDRETDNYYISISS